MEDVKLIDAQTSIELKDLESQEQFKVQLDDKIVSKSYWKRVNDIIIIICLTILNLLICIGFFGYDTIFVYPNSSLDIFRFVMFMLGILSIILIIVTDIIQFTKVNLSYLLVFNCIAQFFSVTIYSSIYKYFFWNIATFGMSISALTVIGILCGIIYLIYRLLYSVYSVYKLRNLRYTSI